MEHQGDQTRVGQPVENPTHNVGSARISAGSPGSASAKSAPSQSILPEATQQLLQELADLPGRILPPETVHHLKNAGRETLLAVYSLWQNVNRADKGASGEKVRKHIEVE
jgi:predicted glycosyl hydrolase (DUF1957 family)